MAPLPSPDSRRSASQELHIRLATPDEYAYEHTPLEDSSALEEEVVFAVAIRSKGAPSPWDGAYSKQLNPIMYGYLMAIRTRIEPLEATAAVPSGVAFIPVPTGHLPYMHSDPSEPESMLEGLQKLEQWLLGDMTSLGDVSFNIQVVARSNIQGIHAGAPRTHARCLLSSARPA